MKEIGCGEDSNQNLNNLNRYILFINLWSELTTPGIIKGYVSDGSDGVLQAYNKKNTQFFFFKTTFSPITQVISQNFLVHIF